MKKILLVGLSVALGVSACTSNPKDMSSKSKNVTEFNSINHKQYKLNNVNIRLDSSVEKEGFLTKDTIQKVYLDELNKQLQLQHKNVTNPSAKFALVDVDLTHKRIFMGEGLKFIGGNRIVGGYADTVFTYKVKVIYNGEVVQNFEREKQIARKRGLIGNFKKIARDLSSSGKPENEIQDLQKVSAAIVADLKP